MAPRSPPSLLAARSNSHPPKPKEASRRCHTFSSARAFPARRSRSANRPRQFASRLGLGASFRDSVSPLYYPALPRPLHYLDASLPVPVSLPPQQPWLRESKLFPIFGCPLACRKEGNSWATSNSHNLSIFNSLQWFLAVPGFRVSSRRSPPTLPLK